LDALAVQLSSSHNGGMSVTCEYADNNSNNNTNNNNDIKSSLNTVSDGKFLE